MMKKIAAITGSRRGIGLATARALASSGYHVVLSGVTPASGVSDVLERFASDRLSAEYIPCDISNSKDRSAFFDAIGKRHGRLDLLVNNAGVAPKTRLDLLKTTVQSFDEVLRTNLEGTFFMCQLGANYMISCQKSGCADYSPRIINICSISAYTSSINRGEYCISKAGISMVTALFADRLSEYGIGVFEVRPGIIRTDMTAAVQERYQGMIESGLTPIRRMGEPEDVANCVLAAASGLLDFATGQVLNADGGFHIRRL